MSLRCCLNKHIVIAASLAICAQFAYGAASPFDQPEIEVESSPTTATSLQFGTEESIVDFDVSPVRPEAALIVKASSGKQRIIFWKIGSDKVEESTHAIEIPTDTVLSAIAWHPLGQTVFLLGKKADHHEILKTPRNSWAPITLHRSKVQLRRLVIGPRPFQTGYDEKIKQVVTSYRIFFAVKKSNGKYATHSITETGQREYAVLDSESGKFVFPNDEEQPNVLRADSALPSGFHPAGHFMLWEDDKHCFHKAIYQGAAWGSIANVLADRSICGGSLTYTPNGAFLLHWQSGVDGATLLSDRGRRSEIVAAGTKFISTPSSVADGHGIVGIVKDGPAQSVAYVPIGVPLANVVNAWMFIESPRDQLLLSQNTGLFRRGKGDQLYELYDSESYHCGGYDYSTPSRPYFVTTDIFWELYASAFEGIFILSERQSAIPRFWKFIHDAHESLKGKPDTKMSKAFAALAAVRAHDVKNMEAAKILRSNGVLTSSVTNQRFDFGNLKPRSHYVRDPEFQTYFQASKYLMDFSYTDDDLAQLKNLPPSVIQEAKNWINVYKPFIAPSRSTLIWAGSESIPAYVSHPETRAAIFPLSWGLDNEVFYNTVYHSDLPEEDQIKGPAGPRLLPSGLDIAAVLGSKIAEVILDESGEYTNYPTLKQEIAKLRARIGGATSSSSETLYQRWISSLATQWSDNVSSPGGQIQKTFWDRKRLQTGLASWATLRHATLLVNERSVAECGEAGFEAIILRPPRGYVEPDPKTLNEIANLFDATIEVVKSVGASWSGSSSFEGSGPKTGLQGGVIRRLSESRDKLRIFSGIAQKELEGKPLTNKEYEEILYVGRAAEHNFLIFKSLAQKDFALSNPDPVSKVADVAGKSGALLLAGVGAGLEWDQVVPYFGRKQVVKGSVYSYYETISTQVMTDEEWRSKLPDLARPRWVQPYFSTDILSCPPKEP